MRHLEASGGGVWKANAKQSCELRNIIRKGRILLETPKESSPADILWSAHMIHPRLLLFTYIWPEQQQKMHIVLVNWICPWITESKLLFFIFFCIIISWAWFSSESPISYPRRSLYCHCPTLCTNVHRTLKFGVSPRVYLCMLLPSPYQFWNNCNQHPSSWSFEFWYRVLHLITV